MRKRLTLLAAAGALLAAAAVPAVAGPSRPEIPEPLRGVVNTLPALPIPQGFSSPNVEQVGYVPFEVGTATGASIHGKYLFVTSWKNFTIYDISDPLDPQLVSTVPFGFKFENEDVATNGKILLFSESLPQDLLHVYDLEDINNPVEIATLEGAGNHTTSCLLGCRYAWGSEGTVTDLRDPEAPEIIGNWEEGTPGEGSGHDITEIAPGLVFSATTPVMLLDGRKNPAKPKLLAVGDNEEFAHSVKWPRGGKDRFALVGGEANAQTVCDAGVTADRSATFKVMDTQGWQKTGKIRTVDEYVFRNGAYVNGNPAVNGLGCSPHWFEAHPTWKDGGLVAMGAYEHGTKFLTVNKSGNLKEVGWFVPIGGSTSAAYWMTSELVYNIDYTRGIDILRYTGPLTSP